WYCVPSVYAAPVGMLKRCHNFPRLVLNVAKAFTTDTAYRIRATKVPARRLVFSFVNSITALSAELEGRHYGGGVLELVPSEIERLTIPLPAKADVDVTKLDKAIRGLTTNQVLARQGRVVLGAMGLSSGQQTCILEGWRKL